MPIGTQSKILRVLVDQQFQRVGGNDKVRVDLRVISSTNRDLEAAIAAAHKDQDFTPFHRLTEVLQTPYSDPADPVFTMPPKPEEVVQNTFCGT